MSTHARRRRPYSFGDTTGFEVQQAFMMAWGEPLLVRRRPRAKRGALRLSNISYPVVLLS
jgi:hypothetical protein